MKRSATRVVALALLAGSATPLAAQTAWVNPAGGNWATIGSWSNGIPSSALDASIGLTGSFNIFSTGIAGARDLTITNPSLLLNVNSGSTMTISGNLANPATITVNPTGGAGNAVLAFGAAAGSITGTGSIVLGAAGSVNDASLGTTAGANVITHHAGHTITGTGQIYTGMINQGLIKADGPGKYIQLVTNPKANTGLFLAQNGATIDVEGIAVDQTGGGIIRADGAGSIAQVHGSVAAGTIEGINGGIARTGGTLTLDGVTLNGATQILSSHTAVALTSITNTGTLTINPTGGAGNAVLSFGSAASSISGPGSIVLAAIGSVNDANLSTTAAENVVTHHAGHTITGTGQIFPAMINHGLISADGAGTYMQLATYPKSNTGLLLAQNGGTIDVEGVAVDQTGGGIIRADGAGSIAQLHGSVTAGTIDAINGGIARTGGALTLTDVDCHGPFELLSGNVATVLGSLTNTGTITINPSGGAGNASMSFNSPAVMIDGGGTIMLNGVGSSDDANLTTPVATNILTNGPGHTIAGKGAIYVATINRGIISPGQAAPGDQTQNIDLGNANGDLTCTPKSTIRIQLEGAAAGQFDAIIGATGADIACNGTLDVSHLGGFTGPAVGTFTDIISTGGAVTGTFSTVNLPTLPNQARYVVVYAPNRVRLYVACYANCDGSTAAPVLNVQDFSCFLNSFASGSSYANCDQSTSTPVLNVQDFACFLNAFAAGCP